MASILEQVQRRKHWQSEGYTKYNAKQLAHRETYVITHCSDEQKNEITKYGSCYAMWERFRDDNIDKIPAKLLKILRLYAEAVQKYQLREDNEPDYNEPDYRRHPELIGYGDDSDDGFRDEDPEDPDHWNRLEHDRDEDWFDRDKDHFDEYMRKMDLKNPYVINIMSKSPH